MEKKCIGVDVGGTSSKIGLLSAAGVILKKWEIPTRTQENGSRILPDIAASISEHLESCKVRLEDVLGVGIGVPGPVTSGGNVEVCVNLGWQDVNPEKELGHLLGGVYVRAGNDANLAALGEMWQGGGKGYKNIMLFTLGTGVGGGAVVEENVVSGFRGMGGEIGHILVNFQETEYCSCGNRGCLEQYASATGIVKEMQRALAASKVPSVLSGRDGFDCKAVLDAAKAGDETALWALRGSMRYLALAMHYISHITDPEIFVIGGGVSGAGEFLLGIIREYYEAFSVMGRERAGIGLATLGNDAGVYGAARLVLSRRAEKQKKQADGM